MIDALGSVFTTAIITFFVLLFGEPIIKGVMRMMGFYAIVEEGTCHVYVLFGRVVLTLREPGLYFLWLKLGPVASIVRWFGKLYVLDMRLDQKYLRSLPVNSEEGAPMGIGVWYEMFISDPVAYLFKNTDPQGSLSANVSNATVRTLSNMPLADMLALIDTCERQGTTVGEAGFGCRAQVCAALLPAYVVDEPLVIGFVYEPSNRIDVESLARILTSSLAQMVERDDAVLPVKPLIAAA